MERLILRCGRYVPAADGDATARMRAMEAYLARLTDELEHLLAQMDPVLQTVDDQGEEG